METDGDYIENKIARGVYGSTEQVAKGVSSVFGIAADEAKHAGKYAKSAARSTRESARDAARNVKGAARDAASTARYVCVSIQHHFGIEGWKCSTIKNPTPKAIQQELSETNRK